MVRFPVPAGNADAMEYWRKLLKDGWKFRGLDKLPAAERARYKAQLRHEMELIESKDFIDYFLLVAAGVLYVKDQGIAVGPARGSAAASVAAWLLRITEVDPLRPEFMGLLRFERFISVDRLDLPDIDLDFPSAARPMLRDFYSGLMGGGEYVSNIGTFTQFKGKNSLDDVARVFRVPKSDTETLKAFLIERSSGDMRASSTIEDTVEQFPAAREVWERHPDLGKASWLEGNIKGFGVHAAGLVLSNQPITTVTSVAEREVPKGSGNIVQVVALDKHAAERQGLVKLDLLGLNTMSMIQDALARLGMSLDELYNMRLDDPKVYEAFQRVDCTGVFQFEGRATRYVCQVLQPERFSEIMDCIALCRPGPLHNGAAKEYGDVKHGGKIPEALHPAIEDILAPTQHQMVYQEQMLSIAKMIGGFDAVAVGRIRKIISLKKGEQEFNRNKEEFMKGVATLHERFPEYPPMSPEVGEKIWGNMITSGAYAFNAAHCAAYGLISYYTQWLKQYHPDVFYAASLAEAAGSTDKHRDLLRDADKHGVRVLKPSLKRSEANWAPVRKRGRALSPLTIRAGFQQVEGIGEKTAERVAEWRDAEQPEGWGEIQQLRGFGVKTVLKITDWLKQDDPFQALKLDKDIAKVKAAIEAGDLGPLPIPTHNASEMATAENQGKNLAVVWLGTFLKRNIRDIYEQNRARGHELNPDEIKDPELSEWALLTAEDESDQLLVTVDRWKYPRYREGLFNFRMGTDLLLIEGVKPARSAVRKLNVKRMWVIDPEGE
jgi:DNA polymerase-3 subunit alpha